MGRSTIRVYPNRMVSGVRQLRGNHGRCRESGRPCGGKRLGAVERSAGGMRDRLQPPWERISVREAFARWASVDLDACADAESLFCRACALGYDSAKRGDSWEDLFHKILLEKVEPELAKLGAVHLFDYPRPLAALAKLKEGDSARSRENGSVFRRGGAIERLYGVKRSGATARAFARAARPGGAPADEHFSRPWSEAFRRLVVWLWDWIGWLWLSPALLA